MIKFSLIIDNMINQDLNYVYTTFQCEENDLMLNFDLFTKIPFVLGVKYTDTDEQEVSYWFGEQEKVSHYANMNPNIIAGHEADELIGKGYDELIVLKNRHLILMDKENKHINSLVKNLLNVEPELVSPRKKTL